MSAARTDLGSDGETHWHEERRAIVVNAAGVGIAVAAYGVSFGAISVTGGLTVLQTQFLSALMFTGGSQFALVGVLIAGGGARVGGGHQRDARLPQRVLRARRWRRCCGCTACAGSSPRSSRSTSRPRWRSAARSSTTTAAPRGSRSGPRASRCSCSGTSRRCSARSGRTRSATRRSGASTPRSPRGSSRWCGRGSTTGAAGRSGSCAAAVALVLTPFLRPGVPVLLTAVVAVVAGVLAVRRKVES